MKKYRAGTAEGMGRGTDRSLMPPELRWEKAAHALCAQVSAEEMEKMGAGWLAKYLIQPANFMKQPPIVEALWELLLACDNQELIAPFGGLLKRRMAEAREAVRQYALGLADQLCEDGRGEESQ